jgi:hypothetical protein
MPIHVADLAAIFARLEHEIRCYLVFMDEARS